MTRYIFVYCTIIKIIEFPNPNLKLSTLLLFYQDNNDRNSDFVTRRYLQ